MTNTVAYYDAILIETVKIVTVRGLYYKKFHSGNFCRILISYSARVFATVSHFHPSLVFVCWSQPELSPLRDSTLVGSQIPPPNVRLGCKCLTISNALAS